MVSSDFRKEAREKLSGKWGKAVCIVLGYMAISVILNLIDTHTTGILNTLVSIATFIIEVPLSFGLVMSFVRLFNEEEVGAFDFLKSGYENFKRSWSVAWNTFLKMLWPVVLMIIAIVLLIVGVGSVWASALKGNVTLSGLGAMGVISTILIIISSIWATCLSYYYQLANMIAIENSEMTGKEAVEESRRRMEGKRGKLFCLQLSFIGWAILAAFTLGIGYLWLTPYMQFAVISFYKNTDSNYEVIETKDADVSEE